MSDSSIKSAKKKGRKKARQEAEKLRMRELRKAQAKAASDASTLPSEQVSLVPAPHARALRCRIERK